MDQVHKLQISLGKYFGSILGFVLGYLQPTTNPYGSLVVKQAENLTESACMGNWRGELLGSVVSRLMDLFLEFVGGKHQVGSDA